MKDTQSQAVTLLACRDMIKRRLRETSPRKKFFGLQKVGLVVGVCAPGQVIRSSAMQGIPIRKACLGLTMVVVALVGELGHSANGAISWREALGVM